MAPLSLFEGFSFVLTFMSSFQYDSNLSKPTCAYSMNLINTHWQAWRLWNEGKELEFIDPLLMESCPATEVLKCMHIGLLCVQEDPADRPTISSIFALLGNESASFPHPKQPVFVVARVTQTDHILSVNHLTVSSLSPRWPTRKIPPSVLYSMVIDWNCS